MGIACPLVLVFLIFFLFGVLSLHSVSRRPSRQFTIRGMMLFIFLWAVCLSQLSLLNRTRPGLNLSCRQDWIVPFAWVVLAVFYWRSRNFAVLLIHSTGVLLIAYLFVIALVCGVQGTWNKDEWYLGVGLLSGSFISLIFFSLMMLLAIIRRPLSPPRKENDQA